MDTKRAIIIIGIVVGILMIPLVAMQFTSEVNWQLGDFIIMGAILLTMGFSYELVANKSQKTTYKIAFAVGLLGAFLLFWVNAAVGIIGNEGQDANLLYVAVFFTGFIGTIVSRFKAKGMSVTLFSTAAVQMLVPVVALLIWPPSSISWSPGVFGVFLLSGFFAALFVLSGILFKRAA